MEPHCGCWFCYLIVTEILIDSFGIKAKWKKKNPLSENVALILSPLALHINLFIYGIYLMLVSSARVPGAGSGSCSD